MITDFKTVAAERQTGSRVLPSLGPCAVAQKASPARVKRSDCGIECQELSLCAVSSTSNLAGGPWAGPLSHLGVLSAKRRDAPLLPQGRHPSCPRQPGTVASVGVGLQPLCQAVVFKESLTFGGLVFLCFAKSTKGRRGWEGLLCVLFAQSSA